MAIARADFSQISVLIIDDSQFVRRLVQELLISFGFKAFNLLPASNAQEAFLHMQNRSADLVICDWQMYPIDGLSILRKLRLDTSNRYHRIPFIMLTGHNRSEDVATAVGEGADSYIVKPFSASTLMAHLLKVLLAGDRRLDMTDAWEV